MKTAKRACKHREHLRNFPTSVQPNNVPVVQRVVEVHLLTVGDTWPR
ncbi:MAG: hypothetical protein JSU86_15365 [Phycisphaerales bacterium]|nr:MAG: hypothetical protein JSU86_15365 [Phycisphaerales bacterium]